MKAQGKTISFDPNLRPVLWKSEAEMAEKLNRLAFQADWVLPGIKEGMILTGESTPEGIADFYLNRGVKAVVLKTGADGAWFKTADGEQGAVAAVKSTTWSIPWARAMGLPSGVISALLEGKTAVAGRGARQQNWFAGDSGAGRQRRITNTSSARRTKFPLPVGRKAVLGAAIRTR